MFFSAQNFIPNAHIAFRKRYLYGPPWESSMVMRSSQQVRNQFAAPRGPRVFSSDVGSFDAFRCKFFAKVISYFKSFSLNEYDLRMFSSVFLIEIFDLLGKELKHAKIVSESLQKIRTKF